MLPEPGERIAHELEPGREDPAPAPPQPGQPGAPDIAMLPSGPVRPKVTTAPPPPSSRTPGTEARSQAGGDVAGLLPPPALRPTERRPARSPRRRRSASQTAELSHPADLPDDAAGRILVIAQAPRQDAAPPATESAPEAPPVASEPRVEGWPAVIVLGAVLVVLFVVCLRLTS